nr:hypothetical protein [Tanacetum cinerariifolium]
MYNQWRQKLKGLAVEDPAVQSLLDLRKGSKASRLESLRQKKQPVSGEGSNAAQNKYYSSSDIDSDATLYSSSSDKPDGRENKKKCQKDVEEPSSRSSRQNRSPVIKVQDDTPAMQSLDKANILIQKHSNPKWFPKKSGLAKRSTTWFDFFLKLDIDKDENHILGPSTVAIAKKFNELIQKDELTIADFEGQKKSTLLLSLSIMLRDTTKKVLKTVSLKDRAKKSTRLNVNDVEDMYLLQVQDKLHHLPLEFVKDFNNSLLMFIKRTMIKNMVEDNHLRVEIYQRTLNLTKATMFFEGINQRIPFTMNATYKGVVYLNQYNIKSLMKLSEVKKFSDGTPVKIQENLIDMSSKNKLGSGNKRLKGRDRTDYDVKSSKEMLKKIDETLRYREQLKRLEEDSISPEDSVEKDFYMNVLEDIEADATVIEVAVDSNGEAGIDAGIGIEVDVRIHVEEEVEDKVESSDRGTMEVGVDMDARVDILDGMLMPDVVEHLKQVKEGLQDIYDHVIKIPLQRIEDI